METYFVYRLNNPIDTWIPSNRFVLRINQYYFKILIGRVLIYPIGVEDPQICTPATNTLFCGWFERTLVFELIYPLIRGLPCNLAIISLKPENVRSWGQTISCTLWNWPLSPSAANTHSIDNIALLSFVTKTTCFIRSRWTWSSVHDVELAELRYLVSAKIISTKGN